MTKFVPYLSEEQIEREAAVLLAEYAQARGVIIGLPIPIEDIVEKHLKLSMEFDDTHRLFGVPRAFGGPDILGAMIFEEARIVIDESLDPEENPDKEGRFRFTLAHEGGGHWRLHRRLFPSRRSGKPAVICRSSQAKERIEWQADFYASCLLMPRDLVLESFDPTRFRGLPYSELMDYKISPLAREFCVSTSAMRIRMEKLGLLRPEDLQQEAVVADA
jgi:hypothetical protein